MSWNADQNSKEFLLHYTQAKVGIGIILSPLGKWTSASWPVARDGAMI